MRSRIKVKQLKQQVKELQEAAEINKVTVIKKRKGRDTVILFNGARYIMELKDRFRTKK